MNSNLSLSLTSSGLTESDIFLFDLIIVSIIPYISILGGLLNLSCAVILLHKSVLAKAYFYNYLLIQVVNSSLLQLSNFSIKFTRCTYCTNYAAKFADKHTTFGIFLLLYKNVTFFQTITCFNYYCSMVPKLNRFQDIKAKYYFLIALLVNSLYALMNYLSRDIAERPLFASMSPNASSNSVKQLIGYTYMLIPSSIVRVPFYSLTLTVINISYTIIPVIVANIFTTLMLIRLREIISKKEVLVKSNANHSVKTAPSIYPKKMSAALVNRSDVNANKKDSLTAFSKRERSKTAAMKKTVIMLIWLTLFFSVSRIAQAMALLIGMNSPTPNKLTFYGQVFMYVINSISGSIYFFMLYFTNNVFKQEVKKYISKAVNFLCMLAKKNL
jgi:hypothetical protein